MKKRTTVKKVAATVAAMTMFGFMQAQPAQSATNIIEVTGGASQSLTGGVFNNEACVNALVADDNSTLGFIGDVTLGGNYSYGARANNGGHIIVTGDITTSGFQGVGMLALNNSTIGLLGNITTQGSESYAVQACSDSVINIAGDVTTNGSWSRALYAETGGFLSVTGNVTTTGEKTYGIWSLADSMVSLTGDLTVTGDNSYGIIAESNASVETNNSNIYVAGDSSRAIMVRDGSYVTMNQSNVTTDGATMIYTTSGGNVYAYGSSLTGDIINNTSTSGKGDLVLGLDLNSTLTGTIHDAGAYAITHIAVGDDSVWNVSGNSYMNGFLDNYGTLDFSQSELGTTVTVGNLSGFGHYIMKTDIVAEMADKLIVTGTIYEDGAPNTITVLNNGSAATTGNEVVTLVETADQSGAFALTNDVELGAWVYGLSQITAGDGSASWVLTGTAIPTDPTDPVDPIDPVDPVDPVDPINPIDPVDPVKPVKPDLSSSGNAGISTLRGTYLLNYAENNTLMQRLGDLRETLKLSGLWFRAHGGKFEADAGNFAKELDMNYGGIQVGYDRKVEISGKGELYIGGYFGYSKGELDYDAKGESEVESKTLGIYGTYVRPNNFYIDAVAKYFTTDSSMEVFDTAGTLVEGNSSSDGYGASIEVGQKFAIGNKGFYATPQAQLSYTKFNSDNYVASNGLRIGSGGFASLLGRIGVQLGYETETSNFYAKVSRVHEFDGDIGISFNGTNVEESFGGSWWTYGIGYTSRVGDNGNLYIDIERASGGSFTQEVSVKAGYRMEL